MEIAELRFDLANPIRVCSTFSDYIASDLVEFCGCSLSAVRFVQRNKLRITLFNHETKEIEALYFPMDKATYREYIPLGGHDDAMIRKLNTDEVTCVGILVGEIWYPSDTGLD